MFPADNAPIYNLHALTRLYIDDDGHVRQDYADSGLSARSITSLVRRHFREASDAACTREHFPTLRWSSLMLITMTSSQLAFGTFVWQLPCILGAGLLLLGVGAKVDHTLNQTHPFIRQLNLAGKRRSIPVRVVRWFARSTADALKLAALGQVITEGTMRNAPLHPEAVGNRRIYTIAQRATDEAIEKARQEIRSRAPKRAERPAYSYGIAPRRLWLKEATVCAPAD